MNGSSSISTLSNIGGSKCDASILLIDSHFLYYSDNRIDGGSLSRPPRLPKLRNG
jgi:hypothetical protein